MNNITHRTPTDADRRLVPVRFNYWLIRDGERIGYAVKYPGRYTQWAAYLLDGTPVNRHWVAPHAELAGKLSWLTEIVSGYLGYLVWTHWDRIEVRHRGRLVASYDITDGGLDPVEAQKAATELVRLYRSTDAVTA